MTVSMDACSSMVVMLQAWIAGLTQKEGQGGVLRRSSPVAVAVRTRRLLPTVAPLKLQPGMPGEKAQQADEKSLQAERIKLRRGESCKKMGGRD